MKQMAVSASGRVVAEQGHRQQRQKATLAVESVWPAGSFQEAFLRPLVADPARVALHIDSQQLPFSVRGSSFQWSENLDQP
jgi:hypothetical protein